MSKQNFWQDTASPYGEISSNQKAFQEALLECSKEDANMVFDTFEDDGRTETNTERTLRISEYWPQVIPSNRQSTINDRNLLPADLLLLEKYYKCKITVEGYNSLKTKFVVTFGTEISE